MFTSKLYLTEQYCVRNGIVIIKKGAVIVAVTKVLI